MHNCEKYADLVSIIIPCYNTEKYISRCLESVAKQTYRNIEVIVVDDGSIDGSSSIIDKFCENDKRFTLIKQKNGGASTARNTGLLLVNGKYITFVDSDDTLHHEAVERLYRNINDSVVDIVVPCLFKEVYGNNRIVEKYLFSPDDKENIRPIDFVINKMIYCSVAWRCSSVIYRSDIIKTYNIKFDVGYTAEDFLFNLKYFRFVKSMDTLAFPTLNVTKRSGSITASYNAKLMDLYYFIDQMVLHFLVDNGFDKDKAREISDSLFCRNVIVYITKEMGMASQYSYKTRRNNVKSILDDDKVMRVLKQKDIKTPYFFDRKKQLVAKILLRLLQLNLSSLAITIAWLFFKVEKILIKKHP
jgi:glycosyltransferase involved in cell wall biosynthesis